MPGVLPFRWFFTRKHPWLLDLFHPVMTRFIILIRQCTVILVCLALGELAVYLTGIKFPSSLIGMLLLALFLKMGWVKLEWVKGISDFLLARLGLFFVPPGVALMLHFGLIQAEFLPIAAATLISTIAVLTVTGWTYQLVRRWL